MHPSIDAFDLSWTVNDLLERYPATLSIINSLGIDACCGGALSLVTVVERHHLDCEVLRSAIENAILQSQTAA